MDSSGGFGMDVTWELVANQIISPEGPAVDCAGNVYLVSRWTGRVLKVLVSGTVCEVVHTGGKPQSIAILGSGDLLLADAKNRALQSISSDGRLSVIADAVDGKPFLGPNDLVLEGDQIVYMTDPGMEMEEQGRILRIDLNTKRTEVLDHELLFPNGITISDDGQYLFVAESGRRRVVRFRLLEMGRRLGPAEVFHQFEEGVPDGIALDSTGRLLVALVGPGRLAVLSPKGACLEIIPTGGESCTNCVFGGDDFQTLYVTEDKQEALLKTHWPVPGQRRYSRSQVAINPN